jgi:hypothetical protein
MKSIDARRERGVWKKKIKGQLLVTWRRSISSSEHVVVSGLDGMGWDGTNLRSHILAIDLL